MPESETKLFTVAEVAEILKISKPTVYRLFKSGELEWHSVGEHRRVSQIQIDRYLERNTNGQ
jgi:excisionase family DNA binding protein